MSYREENGQVVLTMSREDWNILLVYLGIAAGMRGKGDLAGDTILRDLAFLNRLNEGNPNYTPYKVEEPQSPRTR